MTAAVLDLLPLPDLDALTDQQRRGAICVWDSRHGVLTTTTAVDLGEYPAGDGTVCFLRACKACAQRFALEALQIHSGSCEPCAIDHTQCPPGLALVRMVRDARR